MKKKLEADLISIAHRILQSKNKSDLNQLYLETQKLYEKLSVLRFIDAHYGDVKPTIGQVPTEDEVEAFYELEKELPTTELASEPIAEEAVFISTKLIEDPKITDEETLNVVPELEEVVEKTPEATEVIAAVAPLSFLADDVEEEEEASKEPKAFFTEEETAAIDEAVIPNEIDLLHVKEEVAARPFATNEVPEIKEEPIQAGLKFELDPPIPTNNQPEKVQISFADLLGVNYAEAQFVKVEDVPALPPEIVFEPKETTLIPPPVPQATAAVAAEALKQESKTVSLNDKLSKSLDIDLNDRIAFVKHLFGNNTEDYNRVVNQLITFDTFSETRNFIDEMVKPDYNNWIGKDDYAERFMDIIEKKFL